MAQTPKPIRCGVKGCNRKYWWKPKRVTKPHEPLGSVGRPGLFPQLHSLTVGKSLLLPWHTLPGGRMDDAYNAKINPAVTAHARRYGWNVHTEGRAAGLFVLRVL